MRGLWEAPKVGADAMVSTDLRRVLERMVEPDGPGRIKKEGEIDALGDYQALRCDTLPAEVKGQKYIEAMVYQCHNEMRAVLESEADPTLAPSNPGTVHLNALELDGEALCVLETQDPGGMVTPVVVRSPSDDYLLFYRLYCPEGSKGLAVGVVAWSSFDVGGARRLEGQVHSFGEEKAQLGGLLPLASYFADLSGTAPPCWWPRNGHMFSYLSGAAPLRAGPLRVDVRQKLRGLQDRAQHCLNKRQFDAVAAALSSEMTCIWGPPGSGKTVVCAWIAKLTQEGGLWQRSQATRRRCACEQPCGRKPPLVVLVAKTNRAVEAMAKGAMATTDEASCLVLGDPENVGASVLHRCVSEVWPRHQDEAHREYRRRLGLEVRRASSQDRVTLAGTLKSLDTWLRLSRPQCPVVCPERSVVVIADEAGQLVDAWLLKVLSLGRLRHIALVGDTRQLPPFTKTDVDLCGSLERLQRMVPPSARVLLEQQYRLPEALCDVISQRFYDGKLKGGVPAGTPLAQHLTLVRHTGRAERDGTSCYNPEEMDKVAQAVASACAAGAYQSIAVICPYAAQLRRLRERFAREHRAVLLASVDSAQGQEYEHVVLCMATDRGGGFVQDARRLNVACTRCKRGMLVVVAHASHFERGGALSFLADAQNPGRVPAQPRCQRREAATGGCLRIDRLKPGDRWCDQLNQGAVEQEPEPEDH